MPGLADLLKNPRRLRQFADTPGNYSAALDYASQASPARVGRRPASRTSTAKTPGTLETGEVIEQISLPDGSLVKPATESGKLVKVPGKSNLYLDPATGEPYQPDPTKPTGLRSAYETARQVKRDGKVFQTISGVGERELGPDPKAAEDAAKAAAKIDAENRRLALDRERRPYQVNRITGEPIPRQTDEEWAAIKQAKAAKLDEAARVKRLKDQADLLELDAADIRETAPKPAKEDEEAFTAAESALSQFAAGQDMEEVAAKYAAAPATDEASQQAKAAAENYLAYKDKVKPAKEAEKKVQELEARARDIKRQIIDPKGWKAGKAAEITTLADDDLVAEVKAQADIINEQEEQAVGTLDFITKGRNKIVEEINAFQEERRLQSEQGLNAEEIEALNLQQARLEQSLADYDEHNAEAKAESDAALKAAADRRDVLAVAGTELEGRAAKQAEAAVQAKAKAETMAKAKPLYEQWAKDLYAEDWRNESFPRLEQEAKKAGLDVEQAKEALQTYRQLDWSNARRDSKTAKPIIEQARLLPNGEVTVNPANLLDPEAYDAAVDAMETTPEAKARAKAMRAELAAPVAEEAYNNLRKNSDFTAWLDENTTGTPLERMEKFNAEMKAGGALNASLMKFLGSAAGLPAGWLGTVAGLTGSDKALEYARYWQDRAQAYGAAAGEAGKGTNMAGRFMASVAGGLPSVMESMAAGGIARRVVGSGVAALGVAATDAMAQSGGNTYVEAVDAYLQQGLTPEEAKAKAAAPAIASGLVTGVLTALGGGGVESLLRTEGRELAKSAIKRGLKSMIAREVVEGTTEEAFEEWSDQLLQGVIAQVSYNPNKPMEQVLAEAVEAGLVGGVLGGGASGIRAYGEASGQEPGMAPPPEGEAPAMPVQPRPAGPAPTPAPKTPQDVTEQIAKFNPTGATPLPQSVAATAKRTGRPPAAVARQAASGVVKIAQGQSLESLDIEEQEALGFVNKGGKITPDTKVTPLVYLYKDKPVLRNAAAEWLTDEAQEGLADMVKLTEAERKAQIDAEEATAKAKPAAKKKAGQAPAAKPESTPQDSEVVITEGSLPSNAGASPAPAIIPTPEPAPANEPETVQLPIEQPQGQVPEVVPVAAEQPPAPAQEAPPEPAPAGGKPKYALNQGAVIFSDVYRSEGDVTLTGEPFFDADQKEWLYPAITKGGRVFRVAERFVSKVVSTPADEAKPAYSQPAKKKAGQAPAAKPESTPQDSEVVITEGSLPSNAGASPAPATINPAEIVAQAESERLAAEQQAIATQKAEEAASKAETKARKASYEAMKAQQPPAPAQEAPPEPAPAAKSNAELTPAEYKAKRKTETNPATWSPAIAEFEHKGIVANAIKQGLPVSPEAAKEYGMKPTGLSPAQAAKATPEQKARAKKAAKVKPPVEAGPEAGKPAQEPAPAPAEASQPAPAPAAKPPEPKRFNDYYEEGVTVKAVTSDERQVFKGDKYYGTIRTVQNWGSNYLATPQNGEPNFFASLREAQEYLVRSEPTQKAIEYGSMSPEEAKEADGLEFDESFHRSVVRSFAGRNKPVSAAAVDAYGIALPTGYVREGDLYVYRPEASPAPASQEAGQAVAKPAFREYPTDKVYDEGSPYHNALVRSTVTEDMVKSAQRTANAQELPAYIGGRKESATMASSGPYVTTKKADISYVLATVYPDGKVELEKNVFRIKPSTAGRAQAEPVPESQTPPPQKPATEPETAGQSSAQAVKEVAPPARPATPEGRAEAAIKEYVVKVAKEKAAAPDEAAKNLAGRKQDLAKRLFARLQTMSGVVDYDVYKPEVRAEKGELAIELAPGGRSGILFVNPGKLIERLAKDYPDKNEARDVMDKWILHEFVHLGALAKMNASKIERLYNALTPEAKEASRKLYFKGARDKDTGAEIQFADNFQAAHEWFAQQVEALMRGEIANSADIKGISDPTLRESMMALLRDFVAQLREIANLVQGKNAKIAAEIRAEADAVQAIVADMAAKAGLELGRAEGGQAEAKPSPADAIRQHLDADDAASALAVFNGMTKEEINKTAQAVFGRGFYNNTKTEMLAALSQWLPDSTKSVMQNLAKQSAIASAKRALKTAKENQARHAEGILGMPTTDQAFKSISEAEGKDPHGIGKEAVAKAWQKEVDDAQAKLDALENPAPAPPAVPEAARQADSPAGAEAKKGPPSLGDTGKAIWQGWKNMVGINVMPGESVVGVDVHNGGDYFWSGDELMRSTTNAKQGYALSRPATKAEIEGLHDSIDRGGLQIESRINTGATGMFPKVEGGKTTRVFHQATGKPLAEFLETPAGKKWKERDAETQAIIDKLHASQPEAPRPAPPVTAEPSPAAPAKPQPMNMAGQVRPSRALPKFTLPPQEPFKPSAERFAQFYRDYGIPEEIAMKNGANLMAAIETGEWTNLLHPDNKRSRAIWEAWTRQKLPAGVKASEEAFVKFITNYHATSNPVADLTDKELGRELTRLEPLTRKPNASEATKARALAVAKEVAARQPSPAAQAPAEAPASQPAQPSAPEAGQGGQKAKPEASIADFGEKILGARKDLWGKYKRIIEQDLPDSMEDVTLAKNVPEPDYEEAITNGVPVEALAVLKAIRDVIPPKPKKMYKLKNWGEAVKFLHKLTQDTLASKSLDPSLLTALEKTSRISGLAGKIALYQHLGYPLFTKAKPWTIGNWDVRYFKGQKLDNFTPATVASKDDRSTDMLVLRTGKDAFNEVADMIKAQLQKEAELPAPNKPKTKEIPFNIYRDRFTNDHFIGRKGINGVVRLKAGFADVKAARQYLADNKQALEEQWEGMKIKPDYRRTVNQPRQGPERRDGDVTPEMFQSTFGFRGVQFGNWVEGDRRQTDLNQAFDALIDLAEILGVPPKAMSLDGSLGLAFGARGTAGAKAHYEPGEVVINLTKETGPGSLAHEWFHAFDNYFARLDTTGETKARSLDKFATSNKKPAQDKMRPAVWEAFKRIRTVLDKGTFAERSKSLDDARSKPYYSTLVEKAARAFEQYTVDRLAGKEIANDYLVNLVKDESPALPTQAEMDNDGIRASYDNLFNVLDAVETDTGVRLQVPPKAADEAQPAGLGLPPGTQLSTNTQEINELLKTIPRRSPDDEGWSQDHSKPLLRWAEKAGRLYDESRFGATFGRSTASLGGAEHAVTKTADGRALKITLADSSMGWGHQHTLDRYLYNIARSNVEFGDDIRLEGVLVKDGWPHIIISQPWIEGRPSTQEEIDTFMESKGYRKLPSPPENTYQTPDGVMVGDASPKNVRTDKQGNVHPIDVIFRIPRRQKVPPLALPEPSQGPSLAMPPGQPAVTAAQDAEYLAAVEAGDLAKAQAMVDEAAKSAGYGPSLFYHGNAWGAINVFDNTKSPEFYEDIEFDDTRGNYDRNAYWFSDERTTAAGYAGASLAKGAGPFDPSLDIPVPDKDLPAGTKVVVFPGGGRKRVVLTDEEASKNTLPAQFLTPTGKRKRDAQIQVHLPNGQSVGGAAIWNMNGGKEPDSPVVALEIARKIYNFPISQRTTSNITKAYLKIQNPKVIDMGGESFNRMGKKSRQARSEGHDALIVKNVMDPGANPLRAEPQTSVAVFSSNQIKSAEPVTRDKFGQVIPLSKRFNPASPSILYLPPASEGGQAAQDGEPGQTDADMEAFIAEQQAIAEEEEATRLALLNDPKNIEAMAKSGKMDVRNKSLIFRTPAARRFYQAVQAATTELGMGYKMNNEELRAWARKQFEADPDGSYKWALENAYDNAPLRIEEQALVYEVMERMFEENSPFINLPSLDNDKIALAAYIDAFRSDKGRELQFGVDQVETPQQRWNRAFAHIIGPDRKQRHAWAAAPSASSKAKKIADLEERLATAQDREKRDIEAALKEAEKIKTREDVLEEITSENKKILDGILAKMGNVTRDDITHTPTERIALQSAILDLKAVKDGLDQFRGKDNDGYNIMRLAFRGFSDAHIANALNLNQDDVGQFITAATNAIIRPAVAEQVKAGTGFGGLVKAGFARLKKAVGLGLPPRQAGLDAEPQLVDLSKTEVAYHGSNAAFTKFDFSKIGSNEGRLGFGPGFSFTTHQPLADGYRSPFSGAVIERKMPSRTDLINWDAEISVQSEKVRRLADEMKVDHTESGEYLIDKMLQTFGKGKNPEQRTLSIIDRLRSTGLKGIVYENVESISAPEGTKNFTIWDEATLNPSLTSPQSDSILRLPPKAIEAQPALLGGKRQTVADVIAEVNRVMAYALQSAKARNSGKLMSKVVMTPGGQRVRVFVPFDPDDMASYYAFAREYSAAKAGIFDKLYEYWINWPLLSGIMTQVVNVTGNLASVAWHYTAQRLTEATLNLAQATITGKDQDIDSAQFGEFKHILTGFYRGFMPALNMARQAFLTEGDVIRHTYLGEPLEIDITDGRLDKVGGVRASVGGLLGRINRLPGRGLRFSDAGFKTAILFAEVSAIAYRRAHVAAKAQGLKGKARADFIDNEIARLIYDPASPAWQAMFGSNAQDIKTAQEDRFKQNKKANELAESLLFQDENMATKAVETILKGGSSVEMLEKAQAEAEAQGEQGKAFALNFPIGGIKTVVGMLRILFPFQRTPTNIIRTGINKAGGSAIGMLAGYSMAGWLKYKKGTPMIDNYTKAMQIKDASETFLAALGWLTLASMFEGDDDDDKKPILLVGTRSHALKERAFTNQFLETYGGENSIVWQDGKGKVLGSLPFGRYEPIGTTVSTWIDAYRNYQEVKRLRSQGENASYSTYMFSSLASSLEDKSFLQGLANMMQFWRDVEERRENPDQNAWTKFLFTNVMPNLIKQPLRQMDDVIRDRTTAGPGYAALPNPNMAPKIPFFGAQAKIGTTGQKLVKDDLGYKPLRILFPANVQVTPRPDSLVYRANKLHPTKRWAPATLNRDDYTADPPGKAPPVPITDPAKRRQFAELVGKKYSLKAAAIAARLTATEKKNPPVSYIEANRKAMEAARAEARRESWVMGLHKATATP